MTSSSTSTAWRASRRPADRRHASVDWPRRPRRARAPSSAGACGACAGQPPRVGGGQLPTRQIPSRRRWSPRMPTRRQVAREQREHPEVGDEDRQAGRGDGGDRADRPRHGELPAPHEQHQSGGHEPVALGATKNPGIVSTQTAVRRELPGPRRPVDEPAEHEEPHHPVGLEAQVVMTVEVDPLRPQHQGAGEQQQREQERTRRSARWTGRSPARRRGPRWRGPSPRRTSSASGRPGGWRAEVAVDEAASAGRSRRRGACRGPRTRRPGPPPGRATAASRRRGGAIADRQVEAAGVVPDDGQQQVRPAGDVPQRHVRRDDGQDADGAQEHRRVEPGKPRRGSRRRGRPRMQVPVGRQAAESPLQADRALDVAERVPAQRQERARRGHVGAAEHGAVRVGHRRPAARRGAARSARRSSAVVDLAARAAGHGTASTVIAPAGRPVAQPAGGRSSPAAAPGVQTTRWSSSPVATAAIPSAASARSTTSRSMRSPNGLMNRDRRPTISNTSSPASWRARSPVASS